MPRKLYPSDLSDDEWEKIKPLLPEANKLGSTFSWLDNARGICRVFEDLPENHEGMIYGASLRLMLRKLTKRTRKCAGSS